MQLTKEQQQAYRSNGFHYPVDVVSAEEATAHLAALDAAERIHGPMHYRVKPYLVFGPAQAIATHPALLDAVESLLGPDVLLWDCSYVIKEPGSAGFISWHQDLTYWGLDLQSDYDLVSAWVALTPANEQNGAMQFVRGSHTAGKYRHEDTYDADNLLHRGQSITVEFEPDAVVQSALAAGQASLHQGWTVHGSGANSSNSRRVGLVMNYVRPRVRQVVGHTETATLVRGQDACGNFGTEPRCEADFAPANVAFQLETQRRKREVYDTA